MPVTFSVNALLPAGRLCGVIVPVPGGGLLTVNVKDEEVAPPGFVTITYGFPAIAIALAGIVASSTLELIIVVGTFNRLKVTCEPCTNPFPLTVRIKPCPPASALTGDIFETESCATGGTMGMTTGLEAPHLSHHSKG